MIDKERVHGLCDKCIEKIDWSLENHFRSQMDDFAFDDVLYCCVYGAYPRAIIYNMKLYGSPYIARNLGLLLAERAKVYMDEKGIFFDYLVPVPLSKEKQKKRGYNQAELLAKYAGKELGIPTLNAMEKLKDTKSMRSSRGLERHFILDQAFRVVELNKAKVEGANIILVDDVITTGSTANECSKVLKLAGAKSIVVLCFASSKVI